MNQQSRLRTLNILESFGPIAIDEFDDRFRMQKLAFLIQEVGDYHSFGYYWQGRGPHSPALARELLFRRENDDPPGRGPLAEEDQRLASRVRSLVHGKIDDPLALELYASVWYLTPEGDLVEGDRKSIIETMRCAKPHFTREQVAAALAEIEEFRRNGR